MFFTNAAVDGHFFSPDLEIKYLGAPEAVFIGPKAVSLFQEIQDPQVWKIPWENL